VHRVVWPGRITFRARSIVFRTGSIVFWTRRFVSSRWPIGGRMVRRSGFPGGSCAALELAGPRGCSNRRPTLVHGSPELRVTTGSLHVLSLSGYRRNVSLASGSLLFRRGPSLDPTISAVIAYAVDYGLVNDGRVVDVVNIGNVHIVHSAVVEEVPTVPSPTIVSATPITESVGDPAVKADVRTPVTLVEQECSTAPPPIARGPKETRLRRKNPRSGHPVVVLCIVIPIPVPRSPHIPIAGAQRLLIHRQGRRTKGNCDSKLAK